MFAQHYQNVVNVTDTYYWNDFMMTLFTRYFYLFICLLFSYFYVCLSIYLLFHLILFIYLFIYYLFYMFLFIGWLIN